MGSGRRGGGLGCAAAGFDGVVVDGAGDVAFFGFGDFEEGGAVLALDGFAADFFGHAKDFSALEVGAEHLD